MKKATKSVLAAALVTSAIVPVMSVEAAEVSITDIIVSKDGNFFKISMGDYERSVARDTFNLEIGNVVVNGNNYELDQYERFVARYGQDEAIKELVKQGSPVNVEVSEGTFDPATGKITEGEITEGELKVESVSAITETTVTVKLAEAKTGLTKADFQVTGATVTAVKQGVTADVWELTVDSLDGKKGTVTVNGKSKTYDFAKVEVAKAAVENVEIIDLRSFKVTFDTVVDHVSATNPSNYYFEIIEGNAGSKLGASNPVLGDANSLASLPVELFESVVLTEENQALVDDDGADVDEVKRNQYFKENINISDVGGKTVVTVLLPGTARFGVSATDTNAIQVKPVVNNEGSIEQGSNALKTLYKDVTVNVAVRNVRDASGKRTIDTAVKQLKINDEVAPVLKNVVSYKLTENGVEPVVLTSPNGTKTIEIEKAESTSSVDITFNEPLAKPVVTGDLGDEVSNVKVYVNGELVPAEDMEDVLAVTETLNYTADSKASLNLAKAVDAITDQAVLEVGKVYNIKVIGLTDIAGNIQTPSTTEFNVKVIKANEFEAEELVKPVVEDVVQVEDNILRVKWNVPNAIGKITLTDGEGKEEVSAYTTLSKEIGDGFYSYVEFDATDEAYGEPVPGEEKLAYGGQTFLDRKYEVTGVGVYTDATDTGVVGEPDKAGDDATGTIQLKKDTAAPKYDSLKLAASNNREIPKLVLTVKDQINGYTNDLVNIVELVGTDVVVSYVGTDGAKRSETITVADENLVNNKLTIDLTGKTGLLDKDSKLVEGATYTVELAEGFFADPGKVGSQDYAFTGLTIEDDKFAALTKLNVQYIDADRKDDTGFLSLAIKQSVEVPFDGEEEDPFEDAVPQTSKALISKHAEGGNEYIQVIFKGSVDSKTLKNPANYILNGQPLTAYGVTSEDIEYRVNGNDVTKSDKYATFKVPANSVPATGPVAFKVQNVANADGAKMTPVSTTIELTDNTEAKVITSVTAGSKTITLTFDEAITLKGDVTSTAAGKNFIVTAGGSTISVSDVTAEGTTVKLTLSDNLPAAGAITVEVVKDQNGNVLLVDAAGNTIKLDKYTVR